MKRAIRFAHVVTRARANEANANGMLEIGVVNASRVATSTRAREVASMYRATLRAARALEDPCARHYCENRAREMYSKRASATGAGEVVKMKREGRREIRALRACAAPRRSAAHVMRVLMRAYGLSGRFKHLIRASANEREEHALRRFRAEKFRLPAIDEDTGETYGLRVLFNANDDVSSFSRGGDAKTSSLERQMRALRMRVPRYKAKTSRAEAAVREEEDVGTSDDDDDGEEESGDDREDEDELECDIERHRWASYAWEVVTANDVSTRDEAPYGVGALPRRENWEVIHLALLKTTFVPLMLKHVKLMPRRTRRVYERTFNLEKESVMIENMPSDGVVDDVDVKDGRFVASRAPA